MNAGGQGGPGGAASGAGSSGQQGSNPNGILTATSAAPATPTTLVTSAAAARTSSISSAILTSASSTSTAHSHDINEGAIIGAVVGGIAGLFLIFLLCLLCLQGKKRKQKAVKKEKRSTAEQTTYAGLNSAFSGVPFAHSPNREHHDSLLPAPLFTPNTSTHSGGEMRGETSPGLYSVSDRGGQASPYSDRITQYESDHFLPPTYAESTSSQGRDSLGRLNTAPQHNDIVSPVSPHVHGTTPTTISPQTPEDAFISPPGVSVPMFLVPQHTRDTMGFPVDTDSIRSPIEQGPIHFPVQPEPESRAIESEYQDIPLATPTPRKTIVNQDSLERLVRDGMTTPEPSHQTPNIHRNPAAARVLSQEFPRESPVLGNRHTVRMYQPPQPSQLQNTVRRNESQRTVSSVNSGGAYG